MDRLTSALTASPPVAQAASGIDQSLAGRLYERSGAARWNVSPACWEEALQRAFDKRFGAGPFVLKAHAAFLESLHLEDLALALGCGGGDEQAWAHFLAYCHGEVTRAAVAIAGATEGEEIADALLADLYGAADQERSRRSLFTYFHGRSRLTTWLRAIVAQRHVDRLRATSRLTLLDEDAAPAHLPPAVPAPSDPDRARLVAALRAAVDSALDALAPRDRLRLAAYHADDLTLAAIGRMLGEHEATVSRKLQRTRKQIRTHVDAVLIREWRLDSAQLKECYEYAIEDGGVDLARLRLIEPATTATRCERPDRSGNEADDSTTAS
jgi:RNA polymerase sigma factor (sigma-70 family)